MTTPEAASPFRGGESLGDEGFGAFGAATILDAPESDMQVIIAGHANTQCAFVVGNVHLWLFVLWVFRSAHCGAKAHIALSR